MRSSQRGLFETAQRQQIQVIMLAEWGTRGIGRRLLNADKPGDESRDSAYLARQASELRHTGEFLLKIAAELEQLADRALRYSGTKPNRGRRITACLQRSSASKSDRGPGEGRGVTHPHKIRDMAQNGDEADLAACLGRIPTYSGGVPRDSRAPPHEAAGPEAAELRNQDV